jgi:hypothetical protein
MVRILPEKRSTALFSNQQNLQEALDDDGTHFMYNTVNGYVEIRQPFTCPFPRARRIRARKKVRKTQ